ncbi:MAG TPA: hypothetical protein VKC61_06585 [Pyrinomonadaceae bacterium]|nr:hypothetical protein [Pyrinomonadaceae bacterium]
MRRLIGFVFAVFFFAAVALIPGSAQAQVADLHLTASGSYYSNTAFYNVGVVNNGPDSTDGVMVGGSTGLTITSATTSQGTCTFSSTSFSCTVGTLASGASVSVSVTGTLPNFGSPHPAITFCGFSAGTSATASDPNTSDNSVTVCIVIQAIGGCVPPQQCSPH